MKNRPWIWIIIGFVLFVAALSMVVVIAERHKPESVPLETTR